MQNNEQTHQNETMNNNEQSTRSIEDASLDARFREYIDIIGRAIGANAANFPYSQMLKLADRLIGGKRLGMAIYKTDPNTPHAWYTVTFEDGGFKQLETGKVDPHLTWKVRESHLDEVVQNPKLFIEQPARLDLSWLKNRLGLGVSS